MNRKYLILLLIVVIIGTLAVLWDPHSVPRQDTEIASFEECAQAGFPVMESYPRQCSTPDGRLFVEPEVSER